MKIGFYSEKQRELGGVVEWRDGEGVVVECTEVRSDTLGPSDWDDAISVGEVVSFVRRVCWGTKGRMQCG